MMRTWAWSSWLDARALPRNLLVCGMVLLPNPSAIFDATDMAARFAWLLRSPNPLMLSHNFAIDLMFCRASLNTRISCNLVIVGSPYDFHAFACAEMSRTRSGGANPLH